MEIPLNSNVSEGRFVFFSMDYGRTMKQNHKLFVLGQRIWADKFWGIFGQFTMQSVHTHFGPLSMFLTTTNTSHSAYVATETKLVGAKIDGLLPPNFL